MPKQRIGTLERLRDLDDSLHARARRVYKRRLSVLQGALAAGGAYWVAQALFGHEQPFFAPIAAVIILGLTGGERVKRAVELSLGCAVGVGLGDLLISIIGSGGWQITVVVGASLLVASFLSKAPLVSNQVAIGSILIATIMPPGSADGFDRMFDALIGGATAIAIIAIIPTSPLSAGRQEVSKVLGIVASVLHDVALALREGDTKALDEALNAVRGTQQDINTMLAAGKTARETTTVSPLLWSERRRVRSLERILTPVDNTIRNVRVLARRALVLTEDGDTIAPVQIEIIDELSDISLALSGVYEKNAVVIEATEIPELVHRLRVLGARSEVSVAEGKVLSAQAMLAQSRSIIVDLLQVCGMSRESSVAVLSPSSETPAFPPEVWSDDDFEEPGTEDR
ncbi:FUSC family protein [Corynebacterium sp. A21]|uniref:FUSC family protein n=1 Tax=Corynebacterium sp. A21 TaxID=3457318 RepID=UPI003FD11FA5